MNRQEEYTGRDSRVVTTLDRIYTFVVVSAALLALALAFWPWKPSETFVVESMWRYGEEGSHSKIDAEEINKIKYAIKSPDAIRSAIETVSPSVEARNYSDWQQDVAQSVAVVVEPDASGGNVNVRVRAGGNNAAFCQELIATLQEQFHTRYHKPLDRAGMDKARLALKESVVRALKTLDEKQTTADKYIRDNLRAAKSSKPAPQHAADAGSGASQLTMPTPTTTAVPHSSLPKIEVVNPDYHAIKSEIARLELQNLTSASPSHHAGSQTTQRALDNLQAMLESTPATVAAEGDWEANPFAGNQAQPDASQSIANPYASDRDTSSLASITSATAAVAELASAGAFDPYATEQAIRARPEFKQLQRQVEVAKKQHNAALDAFARAPDASVMASQEVELLQPPKVVGRFRSHLSRSTLWKLLIPSALVGLAAALLASRRETPITFYSVSDTSLTLDLPIVGSITTDHGPAIQHPLQAQRPTMRWLRHGAELVLVASLLVTVYALATLDGFPELLAGDAFGGFMTAVDQVTGFVWKQA